ncbi:MATE family efflux transporter [Fusobacterium ulcerans]|uniref:MATE family efflux transporter n=1 Tax=Fusobacterium ulcerans TaxID=861 RepID=UPI0026DB582C|nr:MATE family efflux transporter [Fusobacterium ulcerans]
MEKIENLIFSNKDLFKLFFPLIIEQFLEFLVGLADSIMIAHVSESAVSGVALVDFIMQFLISLFAALATGGTVIAGQYLGKKQEKEAIETSNQLIWFIGILSFAIMASIYILKSVILHGLFGKISQEVYENANIYFLIVTASIPFLALYNSGAAVFRTMKNSKLPMQIMLVMNLLNIAGNAIFVYGMKLGTIGVAIPTLISRIGAAVGVLSFLVNKKYPLALKKTLNYKLDKKIIKQILRIGIPYGLENGMFYFGRLIILSLISTFGTAAIAANSVGGTIATFEALPGMAIGFGMTVVISRCAGVKDYDQARYYTKKILKIIYISFLMVSIVVLILLPAILNIYGLSEEATKGAYQIVWAHAFGLIIWPLAYTLPVTFRASGDARFPMIVSMPSMILCRILLAFIFGIYFNMGILGTWAAMFVDWIIKAIIFTWRYLSEKWTKFHAV